MAGAAWVTDAELARRIVPARGGPYSVDLVLRTSTGNAVTRRDIAAQLHRLAAAAGIPRRRFHDLRHAHASYLLAIGASLVEVRDALRHSKIGVTAERTSIGMRSRPPRPARQRRGPPARPSARARIHRLGCTSAVRRGGNAARRVVLRLHYDCPQSRYWS